MQTLIEETISTSLYSKPQRISVSHWRCLNEMLIARELVEADRSEKQGGHVQRRFVGQCAKTINDQRIIPSYAQTSTSLFCGRDTGGHIARG